MAEVNSLEVLIKANADQFRRELNDVNARLGGLGNNAVKGTTKTSAAFSKMGIAAGIAAAAVSAAIGKMVVDSTKFAMSAVESESLVSVVFKGATDDIVAWSNELSSALGLNAYTLRRNAGVFYNIADALGVSNDNALRLSKGLVSLTGDMASFYNISDEEAMVKLRAGITGETEPLKQLGVVVDENTIKQTAYRLGIAQTGNELSNQEKVLARYMTILEQTGTAQGDLARTLDSPTNQLRILKSRIEQIATSLGAIFIPVLNAVLPYIQAFVVLIQRAVTAIGNMLGIVGIKATSKGITETADAIGSVGGNADTASKGVAKLKKELLGLATFDEMNVLKAADSGAGSGGSSGGGGGVGSGMNFEIPEYDMGLENLQSKVDEIVKKLEQLGKKVKEFFEPIATLWEKWAKPAFEAMGVFLKQIFDGLGLNREGVDGWAAAFQVSGMIIVGVIGVVAHTINGLLFLWIQFATEVGRLMKVAELTVKGFAAVFRGDMNGAINYGLQIFSMFTPAVQKSFISITNAVINAFSIAKNTVTGFSSALKGNIEGAVNSGIKVFNSIPSSVLKVLSNLGSMFKSWVNNVIYYINRLLSGINKIEIPSILGSKPVKMNVGQISYLATGGIVESPAMAMIGEAGKEAVLPLENNTEWMDDLAEKIGGSQPMNLVINLGGERIYDGFVDFMNDKSMRSNVKLLNI